MVVLKSRLLFRAHFISSILPPIECSNSPSSSGRKPPVKRVVSSNPGLEERMNVILARARTLLRTELVSSLVPVAI